MDRRQQYHRERVSEALRLELMTIVEGELGDPRIGLVHVTELQMSPDGKTVHVFVQTDKKDEREAQQSMKALTAAKGYIRHELAERLGLQRAPELIFELDQRQQYGARIEELLGRAQKRSK
jgi:ribosome-binding factor A